MQHVSVSILITRSPAIYLKINATLYTIYLLSLDDCLPHPRARRRGRRAGSDASTRGDARVRRVSARGGRIMPSAYP